MTRAPRRLAVIEAIWIHPFQIALSLTLLVLGLRALLSVSPVTISRTVDTFPSALTLGFYAAAVLGGGLTLAGMAWSASGRHSGVEQAGLWVSASAWASFSVGVVDRSGVDASLLITALGALAGASVIRALSLAREERARLAALRLATKAQDRRRDGGLP